MGKLLKKYNLSHRSLLAIGAVALLIIQFTWSRYQTVKLKQTHAQEIEQTVEQINADLQQEKDQINQRLQSLELENIQLLDAYTLVSTESAQIEYETLTTNLDLYQGIRDKTADYKEKGVNVKDIEPQLDKSLELFLNNDSQGLSSQVNDLDDQLESQLAVKIEEDKKKAAAAAAAAPVSSNPPGGYSRITVSTERGNFVTDMILVDLGSVTVRTVTGNDGNCEHNCNTKPLATYIAEESGFAGMNGTYFCPPDYSTCASKVNSYDFPVYSSRDGKWINADKLFWNDRAMAAFDGSNPRFCASANSCNSGGVSAGLVNYPVLVDNGSIALNEGALPSSLTQTKGYRGAIAVNGSSLYLMIIRGATVVDAAHVLKSLGVQHGINLDGGGSSALYYNGYKVGPGRSLPNAIVLKQR